MPERRQQGVAKTTRREAAVVSHELVWQALPTVTRWIAASRAATSAADWNALERQLAAAAIEVRDLDATLREEREVYEAERVILA